MRGKHFKDYKTPNYSKFIIDLRKGFELTNIKDEQKNDMLRYIFRECLIESGLYTDFEIETIIENEME